MAGVSGNTRILVVLFFFFDACLCLPCFSWEKRPADTIIATALASIPGETGAFLKEESAFFYRGLQADPGTVSRYAGFTSFDTTGYAAEKLGGQIALLRDLFPASRSPYMAYRMGILAQLALDLNSPFATATTPRAVRVRDKFMKDAELHLAELKYFPRPPRIIRSPVSYVSSALERSAGWSGPVRSQYLTGKGYNFIVKQAAARFYNEAIHSVMDMLYTVGTGKRGEVDETARYGFYRDACSFYLSNGMKEEALQVYRKMGEIAASSGTGRIDSIEDAVNRYELILQVSTLEASMRAAGIEIRQPVGEKLMDPFLSALSRLAKRYMDSGQKDKARILLSMCLREEYLPEWVLQSLKKLHGLDRLENLDVPENAWKIYLEANGFESMAGRAFMEGRMWAANDSFLRAAALYSAVPESVRDMRKTSRSRIKQIIGRMRTIPPAALLSQELFQAGIDSLAEDDVGGAVRNLQLSQRWGPGDKATDSAISDAESLQLFTKGRDFYQDENYEEGVKYFRKLTGRFPRSPFAGPAKKMIEMYDKRKKLEAGKLLLFLKGAYEASFVRDKDTVFDLCKEILASAPDNDLRDRAQLLIVVAWYQSNQQGYLKIGRVLRELLRHRVLKESGGKLILRKRIDFYFGLKDPFPEIELDKLDSSLLADLDLRGERAEPTGAEEEAQDAMERAGDEIEAAEELISRGEEEERDMSDARSLLDEARDHLDEAGDRFAEGADEDAKDSADEALRLAAAARDRAEELLEISEDLGEDAGERIGEAESAITEAESAVEAAESERDRDYDELRSELDEAKEFLEEAMSFFEEGEYTEAIEKASEAIEVAEEVREKADAGDLEE